MENTIRKNVFENLRLIFKDYLERKVITDSVFKNNMPGPDWIHCFI